jgi:hypothetical protein
MDRDEFVQLHAECEGSLQTWIAEAMRTCRMLGKCLDKPLTLEQRSKLHRQRSRENESQAIHLKNRQRLFEMARSGYGDYELVYGPLP